MSLGKGSDQRTRLCHPPVPVSTKPKVSLGSPWVLVCLGQPCRLLHGAFVNLDNQQRKPSHLPDLKQEGPRVCAGIRKAAGKVRRGNMPGTWRWVIPSPHCREPKPDRGLLFQEGGQGAGSLGAASVEAEHPVGQVGSLGSSSWWSAPLLGSGSRGAPGQHRPNPPLPLLASLAQRTLPLCAALGLEADLGGDRAPVRW